MTNPLALFADLRRPVMEPVPDHTFDLGYIVTGDLEATQEFFKNNHAKLKTIPHITAEITVPETLHLATRLPVVTRLSLPATLITDGLADHFALDAIISYDRRRKTNTYYSLIDTAVAQGVKHLSLYNVPDFETWQNLQSHLNKAGLLFYDRFHAAIPGHESLYQNHTANFGNIVAINGWSRITESNTTRTRGPRAKTFKTLSSDEQREEQIILGMSRHYGLPLSFFTPEQIQHTAGGGLAIIKGDHLCPTDMGLWEHTALIAELTET